jgi:hypothetical protein
MWKLFLGEFHEILWLASAITGLSMLGIALAIAMSWQPPLLAALVDTVDAPSTLRQLAEQGQRVMK